MNRRERGAAMVEFAIVVPVLLLLALGIIDFGYRYAKASQLNNLAYIAARDVSIKDSIQSGTATRIDEQDDGDDSNGSLAGVVDTSCTPGPNATVTITATLNAPTGFFGTTFTVNAKGVARCDG